MPDTMDQRQRQILDLLQIKPILTTNELVEKLRRLSDDGASRPQPAGSSWALVRTHGGIAAAASGLARRQHAGRPLCDVVPAGAGAHRFQDSYPTARRCKRLLSALWSGYA